MHLFSTVARCCIVALLAPGAVATKRRLQDFEPVILEPAEEYKDATRIKQIIIEPHLSHGSYYHTMTVVGNGTGSHHHEDSVEIQYHDNGGSVVFRQPEGLNSDIMTEAIDMLLDWEIAGALDTILTQDMLTLLARKEPTTFFSLPYCEKMTEVSSDNCGPANASSQSRNGHRSWLQCGLDASRSDSAWTPARPVFISDLYYVPLGDVPSTSAVAPCLEYSDTFEHYATPANIPPILMAAIAYTRTQCESPRNLFALSDELCKGFDCTTSRGSREAAVGVMRNYLHAHENNALIAIAAWNNWHPGMRLRDFAHGETQGPHLDYLDFVLNTLIVGE